MKNLKVGLLRFINKPDLFAQALSIACSYKGIDLFFFKPNDVDFKKMVIKGYFYENSTWVQRETSFPDFVDNSPLRFRDPVNYDRLAKLVPMLVKSIGSKYQVNEMLMNSQKLNHLVIPSKRAKSKEIILNYLKREQRAVLKPTFGSKGENIYIY